MVVIVYLSNIPYFTTFEGKSQLSFTSPLREGGKTNENRELLMMTFD